MSTASAGFRTIRKQPFGTIDGQSIDLYTLTNTGGYEVQITNFGGIVTSIKAPGSDGRAADVVLGFNELASYQAGHPFFGCIIGRYGNRIAKGRFTLDGKTCQLALNNGPNNLHGGPDGFDKRVWTVAREIRDPAGVGIELQYTSVDGEEGFPGTVMVTVTYMLTSHNELSIEYTGKTDKPTICNLTNHSYFNLAGEGSGDILDTVVFIGADAFTPVDKDMIPTGEIRSVAGTPMDFRTPSPIGARINQKDEQLEFGSGYDHNWVLNKPAPGEALVLAATAYDAKSGRFLEVLTAEPGMQLYTGNFLDATLQGKSAKKYIRRSGFCFETQHFPDSPNHPSFPTTELRPGSVYTTKTVYRFSVR